MTDTHDFTNVYSIIKYVRGNGNSMSVEVHNQAMDRIDEIVWALKQEHDADMAAMQAQHQADVAALNKRIDELTAKHNTDITNMGDRVTNEVAVINAAINALDNKTAQTLAAIILKLQGGTIAANGGVTWTVGGNAALGNMNIYSSDNKSISCHTGTATNGDMKVN